MQEDTWCNTLMVSQTACARTDLVSERLPSALPILPLQLVHVPFYLWPSALLRRPDEH